MVEELSRSEQRRKRKRKLFWGRVQAILVLSAVILLPLMVFVVGPLGMESYDSNHQLTIKCHVKDIYWERTSTHSGKGIGASSRQIVFDTTDCNGHLLLQDGVYWDNVEELTDSLKTDRNYEFRVGRIEWKLAGTPIYTWTKLSPEAKSYRFLPSTD